MPERYAGKKSATPYASQCGLVVTMNIALAGIP